MSKLAKKKYMNDNRSYKLIGLFKIEIWKGGERNGRKNQRFSLRDGI